MRYTHLCVPRAILKSSLKLMIFSIIITRVVHVLVHDRIRLNENKNHLFSLRIGTLQLILSLRAAFFCTKSHWKRQWGLASLTSLKRQLRNRLSRYLNEIASPIPIRGA